MIDGIATPAPSVGNAVQWIARIRSQRLAMDALAGIPEAVMVILPTTRSSLMLARQLCTTRECRVMAGPEVSDGAFRDQTLIRSPADVAREFSGYAQMPRTVISFPDQLIGNDFSFTWLPFLGARYSFCVIEALLALRHRPRIFGFRSSSPSGDFSLAEIFYQGLLEDGASHAPLQKLMSRLLTPLECELQNPPSDWLGERWLALKSESHWRFLMREELKDIECLLRLHLLSPTCDRLRAGTAVAAVVAQQRFVTNVVSPAEAPCRSR